MYKIVDDYVARWERQVDITHRVEEQLQATVADKDRMAQEKDDLLAATTAKLEDAAKKERAHLLTQISVLQGEVKVLHRCEGRVEHLLTLRLPPTSSPSVETQRTGIATARGTLAT